MLLDTCTFLWFQLAPNRIPARLLAVMKRKETRLYFSAAVAWEVAIKWSTGRLLLPCPADEFVRLATSGSLLESIPIFESTAMQTAKLPHFHNDPFDRIQICQSIEHGLPLATPDPLVRQYAVRTIWD